MVQIDRSSKTTTLSGGGMLQLDRNNAAVGPIIFSGNIQIDKDSTVTGDVDAGGDGCFESGVVITGDLTLGGVILMVDDCVAPTVNGTTVENGTPEPFMPVSIPGKQPIPAGGDDIVKGDSATTSLGPGVYGALSLGDDNPLELTNPGNYVFKSITIGDSLDLKLDLAAGPYQIFVAGNVTIGEGIAWFDLAMNPLDFQNDTDLACNLWVEVCGDFVVGINSDWFGTVFAPDGKVQFDRGADIAGALYAGDADGIGGDNEECAEEEDATQTLQNGGDDGKVCLGRQAELKFKRFVNPFPALGSASIPTPVMDSVGFVVLIILLFAFGSFRARRS